MRIIRARITNLDEPDLIGLREVTLRSPWGPWPVQFWLLRRRDGIPHLEFVGSTVGLGRPQERLQLEADEDRILEQVAWLSEHRETLFQAAWRLVSREWAVHARRPFPPRERSSG